MTTYAHTLTLGDGEYSLVREALNLLLGITDTGRSAQRCNTSVRRTGKQRKPLSQP